MYEYWIQRHDSSAFTHNDVSPSEAIAAFRNFDWASEFDSFQEDTLGKDCPPGMGISNGIALTEPSAMLLHICPIDDRTVLFNFHYSEGTKVFGFIPRTKQTVHYVKSFDRSKVDVLISCLFAEDIQALVTIA